VLGFGFAVSLVIALWSANAGVSSLFDALTAVYEEKEKRGLIKYYAMTLGFTGGVIVLVLISRAVLIALPFVLDQIRESRSTAEDDQMADPVRDHGATAFCHLQIRSESQRAAMALDHLGQHFCRHSMARRLRSVLLVRRQFRQLQQDLRFARRDHRLHDLDVGVDHRRPGGSQARRGNGASNSTWLGGPLTHSAPLRKLAVTSQGCEQMEIINAQDTGRDV
jgi:hypothetical protein